MKTESLEVNGVEYLIKIFPYIPSQRGKEVNTKQ